MEDGRNIDSNEYFNLENKYLDDLRTKFCDWLYKSLDYAYYSPVNPEIDDKQKYPLIVFLHGMWHWWKKRSQINDSFFPYMASEIMQSRFKEKWAHIILPRSPINLPWIADSNNMQWLIDDYICTNIDNIDEKQIILMWASAGSAMSLRLVTKNPDFYSRLLLACSPVVPTKMDMRKLEDIPIWMVSAKKDPIVLYPFQKLIWEKIKANTNIPDWCRWTTFQWDVYSPDGTIIKIPHFLAKVVTSDFMPFHTVNYEDVKYDWKNYPGTITVNARWEVIPTQWLINRMQNTN